jgi:hypothetical protein
MTIVGGDFKIAPRPSLVKRGIQELVGITPYKIVTENYMEEKIRINRTVPIILLRI